MAHASRMDPVFYSSGQSSVWEAVVLVTDYFPRYLPKVWCWASRWQWESENPEMHIETAKRYPPAQNWDHPYHVGCGKG